MSDTIYTSGDYLKKKPSWHQEDSLWKTKKIIKIISKYDLKINNLCEVGCGAGEILNQLHENLPEDINYDGFEVSPQAFELAVEKKKERLNYYLKDIVNERNNMKYDMVLCIDVFEHVEDYFSFLKKMKKLGKLFIFHIPLDLSVQSVIRNGRLLSSRSGSGHLHYFNKETALATLTDTGYSIVTYEYTAGSIELPRQSFKSKIAKYPRKILYLLNKDYAAKLLGGFSLLVFAKS